MNNYNLADDVAKGSTFWCIAGDLLEKRRCQRADTCVYVPVLTCASAPMNRTVLRSTGPYGRIQFTRIRSIRALIEA